MHATCRPGIEVLLEAARFSDVVSNADIVITGEGSADSQTLMGKLPMGVLQQSGDVPVCLIAGRIKDREALLQAGFSEVRCINPEGIPLQEAMRLEVARKHISDTIRELAVTLAAPSKVLQ